MDVVLKITPPRHVSFNPNVLRFAEEMVLKNRELAFIAALRAKVLIVIF